MCMCLTIFCSKENPAPYVAGSFKKRLRVCGPEPLLTNEGDTKAGRKALLSKVEEEVAAGRVNVADMEAVKSAILDGEPTDAAGKMQYGDIERIVAAA